LQVIRQRYDVFFFLLLGYVATKDSESTLLSVLLNEALKCCNYAASMMDR